MRLHAFLILLVMTGVIFAPADAGADDLGGTAWRLLNITSMDDTIDVPDEPGKYTLEFEAGGRAAIRADCNRGSGSWTSAGPGQLLFGPIAATRAMCPPVSLFEKYLAQFQWVRSYVMKDGHLFLATMADGSIIEFEPLPGVAAQVLGEEIRAANAAEMQDAVLTRLFDRYAADHGIEATDAEVDAYVGRLQQAMAADPDMTSGDELTPEEAAQVDTMRRDMGRAMIRQWKLNRALYQQYGGRVIYQQLGPEPLDAYRQYLEERQTAGDFKVVEPAFEKEFWRYFTDDSMHDFFQPGSEQSAFEVAPWEQPPAGD
jgi:heat shock protein HslJ